MNKPLIVARCGDVQTAPENTLAAFASAIARGADTIELDVHLTRDSELIVHHDFYLGRTDNSTGYIGDDMLAELKALDAGSWFDAKFAGERMPPLSEVLDLGKGKVRFEIDLKGSSLGFLKKVIDEVLRHDAVDDAELTSAHVPLLPHVKQINPAIRIGMFFYPLPDWMQPALGQQHILDWLTLCQANVAHLNVTLLDERFVERLHRHGFSVHGSNLNTEADMKSGLAAGIDQFSTDHLQMALTIRKQFSF